MSVSHYFEHVILKYVLSTALSKNTTADLQHFNTVSPSSSNYLNCFARVTNLLPSVSTPSTAILFISSPMKDSKVSWNNFDIATVSTCAAS